jgi:multisubunit Na+/H+ antiporter MnhC subunit
VDVNYGDLFHFGLPLALCLAGFHGVFFYSNLGRKALGWGLFQLGLVSFLWELQASGSPLPSVLILLILASTAAVGVLLAVFCLKLGKKYKTLDGGEIAGRGPK